MAGAAGGLSKKRLTTTVLGLLCVLGCVAGPLLVGGMAVVVGAIARESLALGVVAVLVAVVGFVTMTRRKTRS
jgi:hypothetical protein